MVFVVSFRRPSVLRLVSSGRRRAVAAVAVAIVVTAVIWRLTARGGDGRRPADGSAAPTTVAAGHPGPSTVPPVVGQVDRGLVTTTVVAPGPPQSASTTTSAAEPPPTLEPLGDGWVTLASLQGDGEGRSPTFHLQHRDTRLRYRSRATSLTVYVVDAARGTDATAGFADAECAGPCDESYMALNDPAGDYYLMVRGDGGPWAVDISEHP